jgi:fermentation-respiration switch protein FrsA (DUF1100 family)
MLPFVAVVLSLVAAVPVAVAWVISQQVIHPKRRVEDHKLGDFGLPAGEMSFRSRDGTLLAGWFIPAAGASGPAPAVVLSHGWARSRAELLPHANFLHRAGYAVFAFDYRHRGLSGGTQVTMGLREQDDLLGALDAVAARPEVAASRIGVFGMSMGSVVAIMVASRDERVRTLVCEAAFGGVDAIMTRTLRHYYKIPSFPIGRLTKWMLELRLGSSLDGIRPRDAIARLSPRPVFVMACERDALFGPDETERVFQAANEPKRFWLIPNADHARGWQAAPEEYESRVLDFLNETLRNPARPREALHIGGDGARDER